MHWPAVALLAAAWLPHAVLLWRADVAEHRLPNRLTGSFALWSAAAALVLTLVTGDSGPLVLALAVAVVIGVVGLALALLPSGAVGMGDAKLAPTVAFQCAFLGWDHLLGGLVGTLLAAAAAGVWLLATRRVARGGRIAFGPFLLLALPSSLLLADAVRAALLG